MPILTFNSIVLAEDSVIPIPEQEKSMEEEKTSTESNPPEKGQLDWNIDNPDSIMQACYKFLKLRNAGYSFYKTAGEDAHKVAIYDFDQNRPAIHYFKDKNVSYKK